MVYSIQEKVDIKYARPALIDTDKFWSKGDGIIPALRGTTVALFVIDRKKK